MKKVKTLNEIAWKDVDWVKLRSTILKLQYRIYEASRLGNTKRLYWLQSHLIKLFDSKLYAVYLVTTGNKGRDTKICAGVDKKVYTSSASKLQLAKNLQLDGKSLPIREKPGKLEKRPLGIPTIEDRAKQALAKLCLLPEWEAKFEPSSYGFRPGRSCHDAIERIFSALHHPIPKEVYDADIRKSFDRSFHEKLLTKLKTFPAMEKQIRAWLKAGVMEGYANTVKEDGIVSSFEGTPQGGIISPLLANIALNGLESHLKNFVTKIPSHRYLRDTKCGAAAKMKALTFIRYAGDFVVIHRNKDILLSCIKEIQEWLKGVGVEIHEKSSLRHGREGFDFLGFRIIQVKILKGKYKVKIYPSRKNQAKLLLKVRKILQEHKAVSSGYLIQTLRPVIIGWGNVFKYCECSDTFNKLTHLIFQKMRAWVFRRDTRSGRTAIKEKVFPSGIIRKFEKTKHQDNWILVGEKNRSRDKGVGNYLPHMSWIKSKKHVVIKGSNSPFDRRLAIYWSTRDQKHSPYPARISNLLKQQNSLCPICKKRFDIFDSKSWQVGRLLPKSQGGKDQYKNLQLLHKACHNLKTP